MHELDTGRAVATAQGRHGQPGAHGIRGGHAEVLVDELVGAEGHEAVQLRTGAIDLVSEAPACGQHAEHAEVAGSAHHTGRDPVAPLFADRAAHLQEPDDMRVTRQDAVEVAILRIVRLEPAFVADAGLYQPDVGEPTPPSELETLPEEQVIALAVVHGARRFDLEFGLVGAVIGALVFGADAERDAPAVAPGEVEDRRQRHQRLVGRPSGQCGAPDRQRGEDRQGAPAACVERVHARISHAEWRRTVRRGCRLGVSMEGERVPPVEWAARAVPSRHERQVLRMNGAYGAPPRYRR